MGMNSVEGSRSLDRLSDSLHRGPALRSHTNAAADEAASLAREARRSEEQELPPRAAEEPAQPVHNRRARMRPDGENKQMIAQVLDENGGVIKEIPPEELREIAARFRRLQGILFDERA